MGLFGNLIGGLTGGIGGALLGGLIDEKRDDRRADKVGDANARLQREFAQNGVRWRVEDAKAAGLHPLAALGVQPAGGSAAYEIGRQGQDTSRAALAGATSEERLLQRAQLAKLAAETEKEYAMASYYRNEGARAGQANTVANSIPSTTAKVQVVPLPATHVSRGPYDTVPSGLVRGEAGRDISSQPGDRAAAAGSMPYFVTYRKVDQYGRPYQIDLPWTEEGPGEMDIKWWQLPDIVRHNEVKYGKGTVMKYLFGAGSHGGGVDYTNKVITERLNQRRNKR